jgi:hypothetical protein
MCRVTGALITLAVVVTSSLAVFAAAPGKQVEQGPIPSQIVTAKRVFISNAGGDDPGMPDPLFSGGQDRSYNQFYSAMKSAGQYELVGSPAEADLLFEIRFMVVPDRRPTGFWGPNGTGDVYDALFRLEIRDPKTNALLWAFNEHMEWAILKGNRDRNFDQASARIVSDVVALAGRAAAAASAEAQPKP